MLLRLDQLFYLLFIKIVVLKEIPIYQGEYTPIGKVKYGLDILKKIKTGNKAIYVLRPDFIITFRMLGTN